MKKVLLATTALVASTGFAMADISFKGTAKAGIAASNSSKAGGENDGEAHVYSGIDFGVVFSGTSDNGIEFGGSLDIDAKSNWYDTGDFEFDTATNAGDHDISFGNLYVKFGGFKATLDDNGVDDLYDDDMTDDDVKLEYTTGGLAIAVTYDLDEDLDQSGADDATVSYKVSYDMNGISASVTGNNESSDCIVIAVGYASGPFTVGLESDSDCTGNGGGGDTINTLSASYSANGFTVEGEVDDADGWSFGLAYSANGLSVAAETDHDDEWEVTGSYDFGSGLKAEAGMNYDDSYYLGLAMTF